MEQSCGPMAKKIFPGNSEISAPILPREREISLVHFKRCSFLIMEQCCGTLAVEIVLEKQESTAISAPILPRERELSLTHAQRCRFLIMKQSCCPQAVEIVPGKHCDFSTYLAKRARAQSGACAEGQFPDYGTLMWSLAVEIVPQKQESTAISGPILPRELELNLTHAQRYRFLIMGQKSSPLAVEIFLGKHCDFITYLAKRTRAQSGAYAEVQILDYGTELWAPVSRNGSWKALRFQHLSCTESGSLVWRMRRGAIS
jgi:hypothetical protein